MLKNLTRYTEKNQATYAKKGYRGLNIAGKVKFSEILLRNEFNLYKFHRQALNLKECYIGPFIGEFGNFLLHMLPFLGYLYKQGVKIHYCGMANQTPFLIDDTGNSLLYEYVELRDFFHEVRPSGNSIEYLPEDVDQQVKEFQKRAKDGKGVYLDIFSNSDLYWYSYRNWQLNGKQYIYDLSAYYKKESKKNKVVIFPRKANNQFTPNNGASWDYKKVRKIVANYFDEVVFIGHPSMSEDLDDAVTNNIKLLLSTDNTKVLEQCSEAKLVITQHSGAMHVSGYTHTPVLLIFNGNPPIKGLDDSIRYRENFKFQDADIAFTYGDINQFCIDLLHE
ncbi:MAG: hypothetical protein JKY42_09655 [Flavobacteriales bacterium]|nr:hypothetical protein [Flavobacteriales bacterium]